MELIDSTESNVDVWLVWSLLTNGNTVLNAVCLTGQRANDYRRMLNDEENPTRIRVWVEKTKANHLYASMAEFAA